MIDFIDVSGGMIMLFDKNDLMVKISKDPVELASAIKSCGGPAPKIYSSSSCGFAEEYGFESQKAFDDLWDDVCELL